MRTSSGSSSIRTSWFIQKFGVGPPSPPSRCGLDYYVIDVDLHQLVDQIMIDINHGTLVHGAGILQPKGHDHVFEQSHDTGYSGCSLVYVLWSHENLIVAGVAIHETQNLVAGSRVDQRFRNRHWVFILRCGPIEVPEIHADSPPAILLLYGLNARNPFGIPARPDESCLQLLLYLFLNLF
jgi:hypothetical protein